MAKGLQAGSTFLDGVLKTLSPEDRARADEALNTIRAIGNGTVIAAIGDGTLAQQELSRQMNELQQRTTELDTRQSEVEAAAEANRESHQNLTTWWTTNKTALEEYTQLKRDGKVQTGTPDPTRPATGGLTAEALDERMANTTSAFLGFQRDQNEITREHFARFNEIVDLGPLFTHSRIGEVGLKGVYELVHKERLEKHAADARKAAEDKIRADERAKVLAQQAEMPYPVPTGAGSGSPLDALTQKDNVVDAASAHYQRLIQERNAAGGA